MKLVIFSEAGFEYGFGHFYRMSGVCEKAVWNNKPVEMHLTADETAKDNLRREYVRFTDWHKPDEYEKILTENTVLVIDSYHVELTELECFQKLTKDMIVIDDNIRLDYHEMKVLNPNFFSIWLDYPNDKNNIIYSGKDYTLLRDEFEMDEERSAKTLVTDVLITMGGTDPKGLTARLIETVKEESNDVRLHVVCTKAYKDLSAIQEKLDLKDELLLNADAKTISDLMRLCDFAVASAGGTTNELIKMQCPAVLVTVADNQLLNTKYLKSNGYVEAATAENLGIIKEMFLYEKRACLIEKMKEFRSGKSGKDLIYETAFGRI